MSHERSTGWGGEAESLGWEYQTKPQSKTQPQGRQPSPETIYDEKSQTFVPKNGASEPKEKKRPLTITETSQTLAKLKGEQTQLEATRKKLDADQANLQARHKALIARRDQLQATQGGGGFIGDFFAGIRSITGSGAVNQLLKDSEEFESDNKRHREATNQNRLALVSKKFEVVEMEVSLSTLEGRPILAKARHDLEMIAAEAEKLRLELEKISSERDEYKKQTESLPKLERQIERLQKDRVDAVVKGQEIQKQLDAANGRIKFLEKQLKDAGITPTKQQPAAGMLRR